VTASPEDGTAPGRLRRAAAALALIAFGGVLALVLAEVVLHLTDIGYPVFWQSDPYTGTRGIPGAKGPYLTEGRSSVRINSAGFRDREHPLAKPPNTLRIAVLGDSYVEALQVAEQQAFPAVLERSLPGCPALGNRPVEVLRFGVSGWGTAQELAALEHYVWQFDPDIVVLSFLTANDMRDNSRVLSARAGEGDVRPYVVVQNGTLVPDGSFHYVAPNASLLKRVRRSLLAHSRVVQVAERVHVALTNRWGHHLEPGYLASVPGSEKGIGNEIYSQPTDPAWVDAWQVTEKLIQTMADEVRQHGKRFDVVTLSNGIQDNQKPAARQTFMNGIGVDNLFYPDNRIAGIASSYGIPVLTLAPRLQAYAEANHVNLHGFAGKNVGHWNKEGHRVAGQLLADQICRDVLPG